MHHQDNTQRRADVLPYQERAGLASPVKAYLSVVNRLRCLRLYGGTYFAGVPALDLGKSPVRKDVSRGISNLRALDYGASPLAATTEEGVEKAVSKNAVAW